MPITDIPILSMLRERMEWHQERQRVLAENVANADTPNYRARDLAPPDFSHEMQLARWRSIAPTRSISPRRPAAARRSPPTAAAATQIRPRGNSVTHEDEMMKVASNQMDYEAVTSLYTRSLALIKLAIGRA